MFIRKNSKNLCLLFTLMLFIFYGCSTEENLINQQNLENQNQKPKFTVRELTGRYVTKIKEDLSVKLENYLGQNRDGNSEEIGTVLYDQILMVDNNIGDKTYIFRVQHPNAGYNKFYNMVLQKNEIGSFMLKLFKYEMTPTFAFQYNSGLKKMNDFQGNYSYRLLVNHLVDSVDGESGGGGGEGGGSGSGNTNDGNTGSPTGGTPYDPSSGNTSSGVGSLGYGNPCPQGGGSINGSGGGGGNGGSGGGAGGGGLGDGSDGDGSGGQCFILSVSMQKINGANGCYFDLYYMFVACQGNGNRPATARNGEPCSGSNNGTVILPPNNNNNNLTPPNPCDELKAKALEQPFLNKLASLNNSFAFGLDHETGFIETRDSPSGPPVYANAPITPNSSFLTIPAASIAYAHVHNNNWIQSNGIEATTIKMFSPPDIKTFLTTNQVNAFNLGLSASSTYGYMVSSEGTFTIKMLTTFVDTISTNWTGFYSDYKDKVNELVTEETLTSAKLQKMLLNLLKKYGLENNIGLYKATNNNLSQYSRISLDNDGNLVETPCNLNN